MQLRLQGVDPPRHVRPATDRAEPAFWVRRLRVVRDLQPGEEHVIRDVELRRGLNIVWAPPEAPSNGNALFRSGVAGHTAGKTTLCRLLRYALGEGTFASETTRRRIREKLPSGWVLAEVVIDGRLWTVARPFGMGRHPCCIEGGGIDDLLASTDRSEYQRFLDAIETAATTRLPASRFPTRSDAVRWAHVLGAEEGHTLMPRGWVTAGIGKMPLETDCPVGQEVLAGLGALLAGVVQPIEMAAGSPAYQLKRFADTTDLIRKTVQKRISPKSQRHKGRHDFRAVVEKHLGELPSDPADAAVEKKARTEKAAALEEVFASRLSVLIGAAGTGKTTLLKMLCALDDVAAGGVLLLAPTGKARVQLETKTEMEGGLTIAQFLMRYGERYDPDTGRYRVTGSAERCGDYRTVIVDECSMLTEEQLAALVDALSGVDRLVLVGDPRQLPPIGSGRPFVDIVRELEPEGVEHQFPRVGRGYAELTIPRRQQGATRADLILASWFGGDPDPAADEIWDRLERETMPEIRFESWADGEDVQAKLLEFVVKELKLNGRDDEVGFECSLGATLYNGGTFFWRSRDAHNALKAESWQIISPVRGADHGVDAVNRVIQQTFRKTWLSRATAHGFQKKIHSPLGRQGIIYGDKVINLQNSSRRKVYPERPSYVANGDVGLVVGNYKRKGQKKLFPILEVEFTSQPGHDYDFGVWEFGDEGSPPLDLAYALTVHKTQGSEFGITFVVLPNPCWLLSLLYTALTRQQERIIILHQGKVRDLRRYATERHSDIARRMTNLFAPPNPVSFDVEGTERFLEDRLIHWTKRGDLVRSKSEVIIANELLAQGFDRYEYEAPLSLLNGETRYPDFTVVDQDTGRRYYWEHLGLLHNPDYAARWTKKLAAYRAADIVPHDEGGGPGGTLIVTRDDEAGGIDSRAIAELIRSTLT